MTTPEIHAFLSLCTHKMTEVNDLFRHYNLVVREPNDPWQTVAFELYQVVDDLSREAEMLKSARNIQPFP